MSISRCICMRVPNLVPIGPVVSKLSQICGRNHSQIYPHICVPNLVMIGPAVWPLIVDTHARTHTHTRARNIILYYIDIDRYIIIDPTSYRPIMLVYYYFIYLNIYRECVRANSCSVLCNQMFSRKIESLPLQQTYLPYLI